MALTTVTSSSRGAVEGSVARALRGSRTDVKGRLFELALVACLLGSLLVLGVLLTSVVTDGLPVYSERGWEFLDGGLSASADRAGISQGIVGSFWIAVSVVVLAIPIGIGAAVYLEEYAPRNRLTTFIELNIRNLAGVPSVVYGLLGLAIFVEALGGFTSHDDANRRTLAAAGVTLAVLVMPIIVITTAEALRAVPQALREGAYGVGATRWEVIRTQVLPYAAPGILTGALLSIARAVGEAAPLIVVGAVTGFFSQGAGLNVANITDPGHLTERFVALPTIVTNWAAEPEAQFKEANASATIIGMLVFVLLVNSLAIVLRNRFEKKRSS
jgi:phosphate transport system permease protein